MNDYIILPLILFDAVLQHVCFTSRNIRGVGLRCVEAVLVRILDRGDVIADTLFFLGHSDLFGKRYLRQR